jgi:hypothetical protein
MTKSERNEGSAQSPIVITSGVEFAIKAILADAKAEYLASGEMPEIRAKWRLALIERFPFVYDGVHLRVIG